MLPAPCDHLQGQQLQGRAAIRRGAVRGGSGAQEGGAPSARPCFGGTARSASLLTARPPSPYSDPQRGAHPFIPPAPPSPCSGVPPACTPSYCPSSPPPLPLTPRGGRTCCSLIWKRHSEKSYRPSTLWRTPSDACRVMQGGGGCRMPALRPCGQGTHVPHSHTCGTHDRVWTHHDMHACRHAGRNFPPCRTNPPLSPTGTVDLP